MEHPDNFGTKVGTLSGTLLAIAGNLGIHDLVRTVVLAAVGAIASFGVSLVLKWLTRRFRR